MKTDDKGRGTDAVHVNHESCVSSVAVAAEQAQQIA